jgi:hypothetical protein
MKALLTIKYPEEQIEKLKELGYDVVVRKGELSDEDYDCDVLHCFKTLRADNVSKFKNLKFVQLASIGFEHLPKEELLMTDIVIANQKGIYSKPIGEWIVFNILEIIKNSKSLHEYQKSKVWDFVKDIDELEDKTLLFLGTGTITMEAVKRLQNFGVKMIGLNSDGRHIDGFDECHKLSNIGLYSKDADFIINVLPSTDKTNNYINRDVIAKFRKGVNFINVSRGAVVNEKDLYEALINGTIKNACLDVFETEPLDKNSAFWTMENVYLSPHISWSSSKKAERVFENLYDNMKNFIENKALNNIVDLNKGY